MTSKKEQDIRFYSFCFVVLLIIYTFYIYKSVEVAEVHDKHSDAVTSRTCMRDTVAYTCTEIDYE